MTSDSKRDTTLEKRMSPAAIHDVHTQWQGLETESKNLSKSDHASG